MDSYACCCIFSSRYVLPDLIPGRNLVNVKKTIAANVHPDFIQSACKVLFTRNLHLESPCLLSKMGMKDVTAKSQKKGFKFLDLVCNPLIFLLVACHASWRG